MSCKFCTVFYTPLPTKYLAIKATALLVFPLEPPSLVWPITTAVFVFCIVIAPWSFFFAITTPSSPRKNWYLSPSTQTPFVWNVVQSSSLKAFPITLASAKLIFNEAGCALVVHLAPLRPIMAALSVWPPPWPSRLSIYASQLPPRKGKRQYHLTRSLAVFPLICAPKKSFVLGPLLSLIYVNDIQHTIHTRISQSIRRRHQSLYFL